MARLNKLLTGYDITDEIFQRTSSTAAKLDHDTIRGTADLEIWTGAGGTGTQLIITTDYTVSEEDTDLSTEVGGGISVYTKLAIVNGTYQSVDLYANYKTVGDYASVESAQDIDIGLAQVSGATYTALSTDKTILVTTSSAVTITIPSGLPVGTELKIARTVASTNTITLSRSGSETIEGGTTFVTHGALTASTLIDTEVVIKKKTSTTWKVVSGEIFGEYTPVLSFGGASTGITYSSTRYGTWRKNGKEIRVDIQFLLTNKGSSTGNAEITIPYTGKVDPRGGFEIGYVSGFSYTGIIRATLNSGGTAILLRLDTMDGSIANLTDAHFTNTSYIMLTAIYTLA